MTALDLNAIKARAEAATEGPWVIGNSVLEVRGAHDSGIQRPWVADAQDEADADFIAHAREDVPALVAEVERLHALLPEIWERACMALGWALNNGPAENAAAYVAATNPYRKPSDLGSTGGQL